MEHYLDAPSGTYLLVLRKGEELIEQLAGFAAAERMQGAWVDIVGGASAVTLGYYDPSAREYQWQEFTEPLEIVGARGDLAIIDGRPAWHIHGTFSRADYSVLGGHVKACTIGLTGEVLLTPRQRPLTRVYDEETGLKLLAQP
ncbi:hypothetical protein LK09_16770 [Microbacterium mangrovi]|uniref:PPC domain-containing protein n=1 Tax=Microbacterium mangrovi TaxID=1348253 RepID=A0A0B1ZZ40_9MICO|nr:PPC domain-containing DNA-binding protein [Microbacterium mangrovi]KHK96011.1 hypothetical protein LK09_16770 [Microbacterium mangrovi]